MTTLAELCEAGKLLEYEVELKFGEFASRRLYVSPLFADWIENDVRHLPAPSDGLPSPYEEIDARMRQFVKGQPFHFRRELGDIRCHVNYIWEVKTPFYRIFGGFTAIDCFIGHIGMSADVTHSSAGHYTNAAHECVKFFDELGLPHIRFVQGKEPRRVISDVHT